MASNLCQTPSRSLAGLLLPVVLVLALLAAFGMKTLLFSPDSWSYYELSKTVFKDFYHANTIRQFEVITEYSNSFPPLYPCLIAVMDKLLHPGPSSGVLVNGVVVALTVTLLIRWGRELKLPDPACWVLVSALLANPSYVEEVLAGRAIPLAILCLLIAVRSAARCAESSTGARAPVLAGVFGGLAALSRFDCLLPSLGIGLVILVMSPKRWLAGSLFVAAWLLVMSPWMMYSEQHFGRLLASDNARTALLVQPSFVMDYYPASTTLITVKQAPLAWLKSVMLTRSTAVLRSFVFAVFQLPVLLLLAGAWAGAGCRRPQWLRGWLLMLMVVPVLLQLGTLCLAGYGDARYFCLVFFALAILFVMGWASSSELSLSARRGMTVAAGLCVLMAFLLVRQDGLKKMSQLHKAETPAVDTAALMKALHSDATGTRLMFVNVKDAVELSPYEFGAMTGEITLPVPSNLTETTVRSFVKEWRVTHIYDPHERFLKVPGLVQGDMIGGLAGLRRLAPAQP